MAEHQAHQQHSSESLVGYQDTHCRCPGPPRLQARPKAAQHISSIECQEHQGDEQVSCGAVTFLYSLAYQGSE